MALPLSALIRADVSEAVVAAVACNAQMIRQGMGWGAAVLVGNHQLVHVADQPLPRQAM